MSSINHLGSGLFKKGIMTWYTHISSLKITSFHLGVIFFLEITITWSEPCMVELLVGLWWSHSLYILSFPTLLRWYYASDTIESMWSMNLFNLRIRCSVKEIRGVSTNCWDWHIQVRLAMLPIWCYDWDDSFTVLP